MLVHTSNKYIRATKKKIRASSIDKDWKNFRYSQNLLYFYNIFYHFLKRASKNNLYSTHNFSMGISSRWHKRCKRYFKNSCSTHRCFRRGTASKVKLTLENSNCHFIDHWQFKSSRLIKYQFLMISLSEKMVQKQPLFQ